jgi:hypothetical protein
MHLSEIDKQLWEWFSAYDWWQANEVNEYKSRAAIDLGKWGNRG